MTCMSGPCGTPCNECLSSHALERLQELNINPTIRWQDAQAEIKALQTKLETAETRIAMMEQSRG